MYLSIEPLEDMRVHVHILNHYVIIYSHYKGISSKDYVQQQTNANYVYIE